MSGGSKSTTTRTEPWAEQKPFLETGFKRAEDLYSSGSMTPDFYGTGTRADGSKFVKDTITAGFAPAQERAQLGALEYLEGGPGTRIGEQQIAAEEAQLGLLSGEVDTSRFDPVADAIRASSMAQLTGNVLPGIRQQITQYNPGGSTRGDIIQANAVAATQEDITNKIASAQFDAYTRAQDRQLGALGRYPSIMGAPLQQYDAMSSIGGQQRAMEQAGIDEAMQRYSYQSQLPTIGLQNYLAGISGDYGSGVTATGPGGPDPWVTALAGGLGMAAGGPMVSAMLSGMAAPRGAR
jgi:hypothetical protein